MPELPDVEVFRRYLESVEIRDERCLDDISAQELEAWVRGGVKSLLMNQARLAGIGNVYSDEMLFHAGVHPGRKLPSLHEEERDALDQAIAAQADPSQMPEEWLIHHREQEATCPRCGAKIRLEKISGRGSYFCEGHQA